MNPNTGDLEVIGAVEAGESYRITVTAKLVTFIVTNSKSLVGNLDTSSLGPINVPKEVNEYNNVVINLWVLIKLRSNVPFLPILYLIPEMNKLIFLQG